MDPITIALLLASAVPGIVSGISQARQGKKQMDKADELIKGAGDRPDYEVPDYINKILRLREDAAKGGLPGEGLMKEDIQATTARGITAAGQLADSPVAALTGAQASLDRERGAMRDLQIRAAQYQRMAEGDLAGAYGTAAQYEDQAFNINQMQPWEIAQNRADAYRFYGGQNRAAGMDTAMSGLAQGLGAAGQGMMYQGMMPSYGGAPQGATMGNPALYNQTNPTPPMGGYNYWNPAPTGSFGSFAGSQNPYGNY
jgi:hypothetical protein